MAELRWGSATDPGKIRPDNEDSVYADASVFVVADGMGGHEAGEVASQLAVDRVRETLNDETRSTAEDVVNAIAAANQDIFDAAISNPGQAGMGTTITAIAVVADPLAGRGAPNIDDNDPIDADRTTPVVPLEPDEALVLANVGDSRTYLFRHGRLRRVTVDHSYVQELVTSGHITVDEARTHPRRNIITRALGIEPDVTVDWWTLPLVRGDRFLLCSDGLVDEVSDEEISGVLVAQDDPQVAADLLVDLANEAGGRDNVTVVVVDVIDGDDPPDPTQEIDLIPSWAEDDRDSSDSIELDQNGEIPKPGLPAPTLSAATLPPPQAGELPADATRRDRRKAKRAAKKAARKEAPKRSRRRRVVIAFVLVVAVTLGFVALAAWARGSYYVDFDDDGEVIVFQGRPGGVLWFDPTAETTSGPSRDELDEESIAAVEEQPTFSSQSEAAEFVSELSTTDSASDEADDGGS